jgi:SAM-dependent methyltransferase
MAVRGGWDAYWEALSDRQTLFREQADEYVRNLAATGLLNPAARVLDFGCGFGHVADGLAPRVGELFLWDSSRNMRERAAGATASRRNVRPLDLSGRSAPPGLRFDLILVNSVAQYMSRADFAAWLRCWREMLSPSGRIVASDLIPPDCEVSRDVFDLLRFSARRGFFWAALRQAAGELGRYRRTRRAVPLTRYARGDLEGLARDAGLIVEFLPRNLTPFRDRISFTARVV